jgi:hypothetical protein
MKLLWALLLLTATNTGTAFAASIPDTFRAAALSIPAALLRQGHSQIENLDLRELQHQIRAIEVRVLGRWEVEDQNRNGRATARWENTGGRRTIYLSKTFWSQAKASQASLALHEYLGALGYPDQDYGLSSRLWFLAQDSSQRDLSPAEQDEIKKDVSRMSAARMGTNSSGGGDSLSLEARQHLLSTYSRNMRNARTAAERAKNYEDLQDTLDSNFELKRHHETPARKRAVEQIMATKRPAICLASDGQHCRIAPVTPKESLKGCSCGDPRDHSGTVMLEN